MSVQWKRPPLNKIYEALGAIGDGRIEISDNQAKVYSSSRNKYYEVVYDSSAHAITANDNGSYWAGYLGYPSIAFLLAKGVVPFDQKLGDYLAGFAWKDINQQFKNDFDKTDAFIDEQIVTKHHINLDEFHTQLEDILAQIMNLKLEKLGTTKKPPTGY